MLAAAVALLVLPVRETHVVRALLIDVRVQGVHARVGLRHAGTLQDDSVAPVGIADDVVHKDGLSL